MRKDSKRKKARMSRQIHHKDFFHEDIFHGNDPPNPGKDGSNQSDAGAAAEVHTGN